MAFKVVQICGGLGNQMFQYAFAKSLQKHSNTPVLLDITSFDWSKGFDRVSQEIVFEYEPKLLKPSRLTYFYGYFQDPRYFDAISSLIKQTFTLPPPPRKWK